MRTIYRAQSLIDAHLVKDALEGEGIPAFVAGEYLHGAVGQLPAMDFVAVQVPDASIEQAAPLVRLLEAQLAQARQLLTEDWADDAPLILPA